MAKKKFQHTNPDKNHSAKQILLSISLLVSGREETTEKCINSLDRLRERVSCELILTDTGCSAELREWLEQKADKVITFSWCNDFAAARNVGLQASSGAWFMFMDDDEWFEDTSQMEEFFLSGEYKRYESASYIVRNYADMEGTVWRDAPLRRMARKRQITQFFYPVHEILWPTINPCKTLGDYVHHYGYASQDPEVQRAKRQRNLSILLPEIEREPGCMHHYLQAVAEYVAADEQESALRIADEGIRHCDLSREDNENFIYALYAAAVRMRVRLGRYEEALEVGKAYLEHTVLTDLARAAICGELTVACGQLNDHDACLEYLFQYLKWREYFLEKSDLLAAQETLILDSVFEKFLYMSAMSWGLAMAVCGKREDCLRRLLDLETTQWWKEAAAFWCNRADYDRIEKLCDDFGSSLREHDIYQLQLLMEYCKGYLIKGDIETEDFEKYNKMAGCFAGKVILFYQSIYQDYVLEEYRELVSGEYQMALYLQNAAALVEQGEILEAVKEIKNAIASFDAAGPLLDGYIKAIQRQVEREEIQRRNAQAEMKQLSEQVKRKAAELLEQGQEEAALAIIMQLRNLVPDDKEVEEMESRIRRRRGETDGEKGI